MNGGLDGKGDEGKWCIIAIAADFAPATLKNDLYMPWTIDLSAEKWNPVTTNFMTKDGKVLGVHVGKTEPRSCLFFNKRVLEEAGIDWNTIYDMQKDGTWTWEAWENIMDQVQRDTDNDGIIDIYGLTGSGDDMAVALVFANGASFFDKDENGKITLAVDSQAALDALDERVKVCAKYGIAYLADEKDLFTGDETKIARWTLDRQVAVNIIEKEKITRQMADEYWSFYWSHYSNDL